MRARRISQALFLVLFCAGFACAQTNHIETATELLGKGNLVQAETEARKALQVPSTRPLALALLGTIRLQQGKIDESTKFLRQALALNPKLIGARTTLGTAYAMSNKPDEAEKCFEEVLNLDPGNLNARFDLAKLQASRGNFQQSLDSAAPIRSQLLGSDEGLVILASDYAALGKKQELEDLVGHWQRLSEPSGESALDFAATLVTQGMNSQAIAVLEEQETRVANHPQADSALKLANAFLALGRLTNAEINAELALSRKPDCLACYLTLAQVSERQENTEKALSYLVKAKRMAPQDPEVLFQFGKVCLERNLLDDALGALSKAVELRPDNDTYAYLLGSANFGKGRLDEALALFQRLLQKHPQDAFLHYAIGAVYFQQNKYSEAEASLKQSLAGQPDQVPANYYLALTYDAIGDDERAIPIFQDLLKSHPEHVPSHVKLGGILVRQHQYEEAQRNLKEAIALDPGSVEAHYQLALALRRLGKSAESEAEMAESHRLEAEQSATRDLRLRLLLPD
ncbi:MAG TPA: tetratricopeptide repeat protein [Candidatus Binatia bacterium]|nr:tetratricopeptide repeat protein [Candidatus Binatia bacterium]